MVDGPWTILGDFNSILSTKEKLGGVPYRLSKSLDFINYMKDCELFDVGFIGHPFTWCNGRRRGNMISKRLDRVMDNEAWYNSFEVTRVDYFPKTGSDHNLLLMSCYNQNDDTIKYFRFLNFWSSEPDYLTIVKNAWAEDFRIMQLGSFNTN